GVPQGQWLDSHRRRRPRPRHRHPRGPRPGRGGGAVTLSIRDCRNRLYDLRASLRNAETRLQTERNPEEIKVLKARISALRRGVKVSQELLYHLHRLREKVEVEL